MQLSVKRHLLKWQPWAREAVHAVIALFAFRAQLPSGASPFGLAMLAAQLNLGGHPLFALAGALAGCLMRVAQGGAEPLLDMAGAGVYVAIFVGAARLRARSDNLIQSALILCASLLPRIISGSAVGSGALTALALAASSVLCYFLFHDGLSQILTQRFRHLHMETMVTTVLTASVLLLGFSAVKIGACAPASILASAMVLLAGYLGGMGAGAAAGLATGLALSLGGNALPLLWGNLGLCGMMAGMFRGIGRGGSVTAFITANAVATYLINGSTQVVMPLADSMAASVVLVCLPLKKLFPGGALKEEGEDLHVLCVKEAVHAHLEEFVALIKQAADALTSVPDAQDACPDAETEGMLQEIARQACSQCALHAHCWERGYEQTCAMMRELLDKTQEGVIEPRHLPRELMRRCLYLDKLVGACNSVVQKHRLDKQWQKRMDECRRLLLNQLSGIGEAADKMSGNLKEEISFDAMKETIFCTRAQNLSLCVIDAAAHAGGMRVRWQRESSDECPHLLRAVESACGAQMQCPRDCGFRLGIRECVFTPKTRFCVEIGQSSRGRDQEVCGDTVSASLMRDGRTMLIISDGMGCGAPAAAESAAAAKLLEQFCRIGMSTRDALNLVNRLLILRGGEDMYSTIDLCLIARQTGEAEFLKIGAPSGYVLRKDLIEEVGSGALPLGILEEVEPVCERRKLEAGDAVILVSDGICDRVGAERMGAWLKKVTEGARTAQELADLILACAAQLPGEEDDMSVVAGVLKG